ncbi:MAG: hypothetical protein K2Q97_08990, partial [Burkholderiaceae bacterium]|nr:hypothetical protein [Burkholderiaceae bacterium]
ADGWAAFALSDQADPQAEVMMTAQRGLAGACGHCCRPSTALHGGHPLQIQRHANAFPLGLEPVQTGRTPFLQRRL